MNLDGAKVVVIGGGGFIGRHVVGELLKTGVAKVAVYDNFLRGSQEDLGELLHDPRCEVAAPRDIRDTDVLDDALRGADAVVHLAAMWLLHCNEYPRTAFSVNIEGTFNVLEACIRNGVRRLVFSSSASVYGDAVASPMHEDHPFNNRNFYGATKIAGEAMCRAFHGRYGLEYVGLRYMNVYGTGQSVDGAYSGVVATMAEKIAAGEPPLINGDGRQAYDFVHVSDSARANVLALNADTTDRFYNVGTGVQTTIAELWATIRDVTGTTLEPVFRPYPEGDARLLVRNRVADTTRAKSEIGFSARIPLRDGIASLFSQEGRA